MGLFKINPKGSLEHDLKKIDRQYIPKILGAIETILETIPEHTMDKSENNFELLDRILSRDL